MCVFPHRPPEQPSDFETPFPHEVTWPRSRSQWQPKPDSLLGEPSPCWVRTVQEGPENGPTVLTVLALRPGAMPALQEACGLERRPPSCSPVLFSVSPWRKRLSPCTVCTATSRLPGSSGDTPSESRHPAAPWALQFRGPVSCSDTLIRVCKKQCLRKRALTFPWPGFLYVTPWRTGRRQLGELKLLTLRAHGSLCALVMPASVGWV